MAKVKSITTTIEDEVTFMVDPNVEYVSLVKYGANRAPFKVLKEEKTKEETNMNKVVQSVLVRNDLTDEDIAKALEGIDKRDAKKYASFTAYPQVSIEKVDKESVVVVKHEDVDGIYFVLGDLAEGASEGGTLMVDAKEAVDFATLDNLYVELYAMADVVGGAMRQENANATYRKKTILTAIDNFRSFAEVVLESLSAKKLEKAVNPKDHPTLVEAIINAPVVDLTGEDDDTTEDKKDDEKKDETTDDKKDETTEGNEDKGTTDNQFDNFVTSFNASMEDFGNKLIGAITEIGKEVKKSNEAVKESIDKVTEGVEEVRNTTLAMKSETEEDDSHDDTDSKSVFKGILFSK